MIQYYVTYVGKGKEVMVTGCGVYKRDEKVEISEHQYNILTAMRYFRTEKIAPVIKPKKTVKKVVKEQEKVIKEKDIVEIKEEKEENYGSL